MKVQEIMTTKVESISPGSTLRTAARKMSQLDIGSMAIVEDGKLLGIITDRDIACFAVAMGRDLNSTEVQTIMAKQVATCRVDQDINDAAHLMKDLHIRRLAVVNQDNSMAGFLSVDDLVRGSHNLAGEVLEAAIANH